MNQPTMSIFLAGCGAHGFGQEEPKLRLLLLITTTEQVCLLPKPKNTPHGFQLHTVADATELLFLKLFSTSLCEKKKVPPHPQYPGWDLLAGSRINYRRQVVTEDRSCVGIHFPSPSNGAGRLDTRSFLPVITCETSRVLLHVNSSF